MWVPFTFSTVLFNPYKAEKTLHGESFSFYYLTLSNIGNTSLLFRLAYMDVLLLGLDELVEWVGFV